MDENSPVRVANSEHSGRSPIAHGKKRGKIKREHLVRVIISFLIIVVIVFIGWFFYKSSTSSNIDNGKYQAVFLSNGQVYFGKLQPLNGDYMKLTDIFYLQTKSSATSENPQETTSDTSSQVELIKLGGEIHGPNDEMIISKDQILFFENLKKDSQVSTTITEYQNK